MVAREGLLDGEELSDGHDRHVHGVSSILPSRVFIYFCVFGRFSSLHSDFHGKGGHVAVRGLSGC